MTTQVEARETRGDLCDKRSPRETLRKSLALGVLRIFVEIGMRPAEKG